MIIYSTKLDTAASVITAYGGTAWISLSGYMLRGATSGVIANSNTKTGGNDSVSYTPNGSIGNTTLNINQIPSHNHSGTTGGSGGHSHDLMMGVSYFVDIHGQGTGVGGYANTTVAAQNTYKANCTTSVDNHQHSIPFEGGGQGHNHTFNGTQATINTLPAYKSVYIWERTA